MKPDSPSSQTPVGAGRRSSGRGISPLPMEWMDPMSWRLPSGMALAEFALQTGFLAPLMMRAPKLKKRTAGDVAAQTANHAASHKMDAGVVQSSSVLPPVEEAPGRKASFWQTR
jgi:hypothetical protein